MTINPLTRWRPKAALLTAAAAAALGVAAIPAFASAAPATAILTGPTVHEQQNLSVSVPVATNNVHTTVTTSPVLAPHTYLVNLVMAVDNIAPGSDVLCGVSTTTAGDIVTGNYGELTNEGTTATGGNCAETGTITINNSNDKIIAWATVITGPGGATAHGFSMNELPVGSVVITH